MGDNIFLAELINRYPQLLPVESEIRKAAESIIFCYPQGVLFIKSDDDE